MGKPSKGKGGPPDNDAGGGSNRPGRLPKGDSKGKENKPAGEKQFRIAVDDKNYDNSFNPSKGNGKKGKKGKGKGKGGRKKQVDEALEDADFEIPKLVNRQVIQGVMDPSKVAEMRRDAIARHKEFKARNDPATFKREYKCHVSVTGITNASPSNWETFMAISMSRAGEASKKNKQLKADYAYSKSYIIPANSKKTLRVAEKVYTTKFKGSYEDLKRQELRMDLWIVVASNFNQHLGTAVKNLYDCGCEAVYQTVPIKGYKSGSHMGYDLGIIHLSALVSEVFTFTINLNNWQFLPPAGTPADGSSKSLVFKMPTGLGAYDTKSTNQMRGPKYGWVSCHSYFFEGTKIALTCASFEVNLISNGGMQGKSVISLGGAGDFPIATGNVKTLTDNPARFHQGRLGGGITVTCRSKLLPPNVFDVDPSIPAPAQPGHSVVMYHLDPNTQYLLLEVMSAEGLPIADFDLGTSNPFVRVRYDGVVQQSMVVEGSLRPVWNQLFYLPVRYISDAMYREPRFYNTILPEELKSKGYIEIEVWHMDGVPTEFLGSYRLDPRLTRFGEDTERAVCEKMAKLQKMEQPEGDADDEEEEKKKRKKMEEETQGIHPKLMRKQKTKVYGLSRQKLVGTRLQVTTQPKISLECCFLPDFPPEVVFPEQDNEKNLSHKFLKQYEEWSNSFELFNQDYYAWFPDAPACRSFPCYYQDIRGDNMPLPYLISTLALPKSLERAEQVMHWIRCLEFIVPAKQKSKGQIDRWQTPETTLAMRKGSVQDHAVLLCCALLGLRTDAWVCKGKARGQDHAWVMTREKGGYVTFWESTTGAKYHLPNRWSNDPAHGPKMKQEAQQRNARRKVMPDWEEKAVLRREGGRRVQLTDLEDLTRLPFSPDLSLAEPKNIVLLPYESIEVVFNATQVYGNKGNHHPACIFFDFEGDEKNWSKFMNQKEQQLLAVGKGVAIPVGPAISEFVTKQMQDNIENEIKESIRMTRVRKGFESVFDEKEELQELLTQYLTMLEKEIKLDIDWMIDDRGAQQKAPGHPSPFNGQGYAAPAQKAWREYWQEKAALEKQKFYLPVKENHVLSGVPFHFSGTDIKEIRHHLMDCKPVLEYLNLQDDSAVYFCCAKVFPMANSVASVWCWVGVQMPLSGDEVFQLANEQEKAKTTRNPTGGTDPSRARGKGGSPDKGNAKGGKGGNGR